MHQACGSFYKSETYFRGRGRFIISGLYFFNVYVICRVYWPLFVLIFYAICPIPHFIAKRVSDDTDAASSACIELAYFFTTGIVVSAFGLPIILANVSVVRSYLIIAKY